jgi:hypothetical protein
VFGAEVPRVVLTLLALIALAAPASADAKRKVPQGYIGMNWDRTIAGGPPDLIAAQFPMMAEAGAESLRTTFVWGAAQPEENGPIDLSATDDVVARAAAGRMRVLPVVIVAPSWARLDPDHAYSPARDPSSIRAYARALVERYGPRGTLWSERPDLPRVPIRHWQFWNEIHFKGFWQIEKGMNHWKSYVKRLKVFRAAIRSRDRRAQIVLGGLAYRCWVYLDKLYDAGAKRHIDVVAVHPFTVRPRGVVLIVRYTRRVMKRHKDNGTPLWITELNRPASDGKVDPDQDLDTTDAGMKRWLTGTYRQLVQARDRPLTRVDRTFWYSWATEYSPLGETDMFRFAGLFGYDGRGEPEEKPAYDAFVRTARRFEGCTKTSSGLCR